MTKSKEQLEMELRILEMFNNERETTDRRYAIKLIEKVVFALVGLLCVGVIGALLNTVIK
jgi:hypothetical protein